MCEKARVNSFSSCLSSFLVTCKCVQESAGSPSSSRTIWHVDICIPVSSVTVMLTRIFWPRELVILWFALSRLLACSQNLFSTISFKTWLFCIPIKRGINNFNRALYKAPPFPSVQNQNKFQWWWRVTCNKQGFYNNIVQDLMRGIFDNILYFHPKPFQGFQSVKYFKMRPAGICTPMQVLKDWSESQQIRHVSVFVLADSLSEPAAFIHLEKAFHKDLNMWAHFLASWNGVNLFLTPFSLLLILPPFYRYCRVGGIWGIPSSPLVQWQVAFPPLLWVFPDISITWQEFFPIYLACAV